MVKATPCNQTTLVGFSKTAAAPNTSKTADLISEYGPPPKLRRNSAEKRHYVGYGGPNELLISAER
ncbi:hypothetical protein ZHAS_00000219 [Anopheles sinensis]|uniref:Uncharacterized protein n=1 Tax=Anopheles sinensis TaxID=74873 RepID=A0A084VA15_ANOSI|nr:hypothetical protein ZHAS_00000219 [Anopheles sinensis]